MPVGDDFVLKPLQDAGLSILFAVLGFILLFVGYRVFDWMTPTSLNSDVFEKGNVAAAILAGLFLIALAIVIHAAIS
jgi:putative membrane protein